MSTSDPGSTPPPPLPPGSVPASQPVAAVPTFTFGGYAALPGQLEGVGFGLRLVARLIDIAFHFIIALFTGFVLGFGLGVYAGMTHQPFAPMWARATNIGLWSFGSALLGSVAYHTLSESLGGSTLGKRILSMTVVQENGSPCRFDSALIRSLGYFVDALFFGLIGYFAMKDKVTQQRYGDQWAHTIVCKREKAPPQGLRGGGQVALGIFAGAAADGLCLGLPYVIGLLLNS